MNNVTWADLSEAQREAVQAIAVGARLTAIPFGLKLQELADINSEGFAYLTPKGRAVFESGNPPTDAGAAFDPYDYSVMTAAELLDVAREAWQKYDLKEVVDEYADMGASVMLDLAMNATPSDAVDSAAIVEAGAVTVYGAYEQQLWKSGTLVLAYADGYRSNVHHIEQYGRNYAVYVNEAVSHVLLGEATLRYTPATDELADLRAQLAEAQADNARLVAQAKVADDHADTYDAAYGLLREDARLLRRALAKHAPDVLKELPLNDRGQEWDKVNSIVDGLRHRIVYLRAALRDVGKTYELYDAKSEASAALERDDKQHTAKYERAADAGSE